MPNRASDADINLVPAEGVGAASYERDFYSWTIEQARLVREGRFDGLDRENVAEEIESLGREQYNKLESALRILLMHMLKWDHQPERRGRSWVLSIKAQRIHVDRVLHQNPGLKPRLAEAIEDGYRLARIEAAQETDMDEDIFLELCPYHWNEIATRDFVL